MLSDRFPLARRTATTALALIGLVSGREAFAIRCDDLPFPSVTLRLKEAPVTLDTTYDYKSISVLASKEHHRKRQVLGLTKGITRIQYQIDFQVVVDPTRRWECVSPQITVTYGFDPMTVYVAREFPQGSCAFNEIYQHEQKHVQTYRNHLAAIEKDMAETLAGMQHLVNRDIEHALTPPAKQCARAPTCRRPTGWPRR